MIKIKRIYEPAEEVDGKRILIDRLWPRGVSKEKASLDVWLKDVAPSPALRTWFAHDKDRFKEFSLHYLNELSTDPDKQSAIKQLLDLASTSTVTLLYAAKDKSINHATVLQQYLLKKLSD